MISITILTKNSSKHIEAVLKSLLRFPEVICYDTGSTDATLEIASRFDNVVIHRGEFVGFGPTHNIASELARSDWILSIDSDEILTQELADEILSLTLQDDCVYSFRRNNYFRNTFVKGCGWYPDYVIRLYNKKRTQFTSALVHESISTTQVTIVKLTHPCLHYPYETISDFLLKLQSYSTLFALQYKGKRKSSLFKALRHGSFAFFKSYFLKNGLFLGQVGFIISLYNAHTAYYKYLKLDEENKLLEKTL